MKKFLSLVLALVMTMSLVTVSAGATDFEDDGDITYQEAVTVIAGLGSSMAIPTAPSAPTKPSPAVRPPRSSAT